MEKLCNSLHIRLLMRISNKVNVSTKLTEIITKPAAYPLFNPMQTMQIMCTLELPYFTNE
jgi:hypothetical protein